VALIATKTKLTVSAAGDLNKVEVDIEGDDITIDTTSEHSRAKYSIEYLKKMLSGSKISDEVRVSFSTNYPVKIHFVAIDKMSLSFVLAPRVEEN